MFFRNAIKKPSWRGCAIGLFCALALWAVNNSSLLRLVENWAFDECFVLRGDRSTRTAEKIVIVAIDQQSLEKLDKPLMYIAPELAQIVNYLNTQGAATVAIDLLIPENLQNNEELRPGALGDVDVLSQAASRLKKVVFPELMTWGKSIGPVPELQFATQANNVPLGYANLSIEPDLHLRSQQLRANPSDGKEQETHLSFALVTYGIWKNKSQNWFFAEQLIDVDGRPIPIDSEGRLQVNYVGPPGTIPAIAFHKVLAAAKGETRVDYDFRDKVVLIGLTGPDQPDQFATPYETPSILSFLRSSWRGTKPALMPGVEVHANVLATLGDGQYITTPILLSTPWLLILFGMGMGAFLARSSLEVGAILTFAHHWAWKLVCVLALWYGQWHVEAVSMLILGMLVYATVFALRWRWLRRTMGLFKSESIARALEADPSKLDLRGEERQVTVMFSDIRNFTTFSERHTPQEVVRLLNAYFGVVIPEIEAHGGTINQYIGDGLMVIFGAPETQLDHATRAFRAAVGMLRRVDMLKDRWRQLGAEDFRIGVGIHSGNVVVGTVGSPRRLDYTAIGDTVNTAARIEAGNKELQTEILISETTIRQIPASELRKLARVGESRELQAKGKQQILQVHSISLCARAGAEPIADPMGADQKR